MSKVVVTREEYDGDGKLVKRTVETTETVIPNFNPNVVPFPSGPAYQHRYPTYPAGGTITYNGEPVSATG